MISRENILRPGGMINQFDQSENQENDYVDAREKPSNIRLSQLGFAPSLNSKDQNQEGAIQIVDQQENKEVDFKQFDSGEYPNRFGNTEPVAR